MSLLKERRPAHIRTERTPMKTGSWSPHAFRSTIHSRRYSLLSQLGQVSVLPPRHYFGPPDAWTAAAINRLACSFNHRTSTGRHSFSPREESWRVCSGSVAMRDKNASRSFLVNSPVVSSRRFRRGAGRSWLSPPRTALGRSSALLSGPDGWGAPNGRERAGCL